MDGGLENYIMKSAAEIAARDGVSKQAVSKSIQSIIAANPIVPVERDARGRITKVSLAHYDHHRERFMNPAKTAKPAPHVSDPDSFEESRRQLEWLKVQREKIRLDEVCANLRRTDKVREAISLVTHEIMLVIDRMPNRAQELANIVAKEGVPGVRLALTHIAFDISNDIADRLEEIAQEAPEFDPLIDATVAVKATAPAKDG